MKNKIIFLGILIISLVSVISLISFENESKKEALSAQTKKSHWLILHRKAGKEFLYYGSAGDVNNSRLVKIFQVKTGGAMSPTPLPKLLGRQYWKIIKKESSEDNSETAPYFLQLDVPSGEDWPYGPVPYEECKDAITGEKVQCDWVLPGYFGLHGVNGNDFKLAKDDPGSSGCIRHLDSDITYLYNLLTPESEEIRYYIEDI